MEREPLESARPEEQCRQCGSHKPAARPGEAARNIGIAKRLSGIVCIVCGAVLVRREVPAARRVQR